VVAVNLLHYEGFLFHSRRQRVGRVRVGSRVCVVDSAGFLDRDLDVNRVAELNSLAVVVIVDGICVDFARIAVVRSEVVHFFVWAEWHNDFDWATEANNLDAIAFFSQ
jgi:hypothetical protein